MAKGEQEFIMLEAFKRFKLAAIILTIVLLAALAAGVVLSYTVLKDLCLWDYPIGQYALIGVFVASIIAGALRAKLAKPSRIEGGVVVRHGIGSFIEHWYTAFGIFAAFVSGVILGLTLGFCLIGPFAHTAADVVAPLNLHYFAVILLTFGGGLFTTEYIFRGNIWYMVPKWHEVIKGFLGKYTYQNYWEEPDKYMASQKSAAVPYYLIGVVCFLSGAIKFGSHIITLNGLLVGLATMVHDYFALFIIFYTCVHVMIVVILGHWASFWSWWTFDMTFHETKHHFKIWYEKLGGK